MYGPPPWGWPPPAAPYGPTFPESMRVVYVPTPPEKPADKRSVMDMIQEAENAELAWKAIKKRLKEEEKKDKDDDKKEKKDKDKDINWKKVFETAGVLSIGSFPVIWLQLTLLHYVSTLMNVH